MIKTVKICPKCQSKHIELWFGKEAMGIKPAYLYYCKDCGYLGQIVLEEDNK